MSISNILSTGYASPATESPFHARRDAESSVSRPASWGSDTVSFSPAALAAMQAEESEKQEKSEDDGTAAFAKYMRKARGEEASSASNPEEQLERLKERLKKLSEQKAAIATKEDGSPQATKDSKMEALDAEINQVISQIAELEGLITQKNGKGTG